MVASFPKKLHGWFDRRVLAPLQRHAYRHRDFDLKSPTDILVIYHHLGLGDHFICRGLVLELADRYVRREVLLPVKKHNLPTVSALYADEPRIKPFVVDAATADADVYRHADATNAKLLRVGFERTDPLRWDRSFYDQVGVPFETSWSRFTPRPAEEEAARLYRTLVHETPYALVHADASFGRLDLAIDSSLPRILVSPQQTTSGLLAWMDIIDGAEEIHCIDSSVVHLVDRMRNVPGQRLYLHDARRSGCTFETARDWTRVSYPALPS